MKRFLAAVSLGAIGICLLCLALITCEPLPPLSVKVPIDFFDISPDNEDAGNILCQPTEPCVSQQNGGRVNGLAVVPDAPGTYFAASEVGGLFKSTNGGASWVHLDGHVPATMWDVAAEPGGQRVFATSFSEGRVDKTAPLQVSTDGGVTWSGRLPAAPTGCAQARATQPSAFGIALRPATSEVFVGTNCGLSMSNDAGEHWTRFDPTPNDEPSPVWDIVALPGGRTYACGKDGLMTSPDGQPGSWKKLASTPPLSSFVKPGVELPGFGGFCSLAVSPDDSNVVFVVFATGGRFSGEATGADGIFFEGHVDAAGAAVTLTKILNPDDLKDQLGTKRNPFVVTNKRSYGYDLWLGAGSLWRVKCDPNCPVNDRSKWLGSFTDHIGTWPGPCNDACRGALAHGDSGDLEFDPTASVDACPVLYSSDGGVYANTIVDPIKCHDPVFQGENKGLHAFLLRKMEGIHIQGMDAEDIYLALLDNGFFSTRDAGKNTPSWRHPLSGDADDVAADATQVVVEQPARQLQVGDPGFQTFKRVIDSGVGAGPLPDLIDSAGESGRFMMVIRSSDCCTVTPMVFTSTPLGVRDITDISSNPLGSELGNWPKEAPPPCHIVVGVGPHGAQPYVLAGKNIWAFLGPCSWPASREGQADNADNELWTCREKTPGVKEWVHIEPVPLGATGFGLIAVDPVNTDRLYASVVGNGPPRMVRSNNGGNSWVSDEELTDLMSASGSFLPYPGVDGDQIWPFLQPLMVAFDPEDPDILVAGGTSSGVFISSNGGENWFRLTDPFTPGISGIPHLPRPTQAHFDHGKPGTVRVYLGTGRGVWRVDLPLIDVSITKVGSPNPVVIGSDITYTIEVGNLGRKPTGSLELSDDLPANVIFQSLTPAPGWSCSTPPVGSVGRVTCTRSGLPAESLNTFSLVAKVDCSVADGAVITNTAAVATQLPDPNLNNNLFTAKNQASNPPPVITGAAADPSVLWPPNHKLENVTVNYTVTDNCPLPPNSCTLSVTSNETINATSPDWIILDAHHVQLRAERAGAGNGRIYTIGITCTDSGGNSAQQSVAVSVPHDQGRK